MNTIWLLYTIFGEKQGIEEMALELRVDGKNLGL